MRHTNIELITDGDVSSGDLNSEAIDLTHVVGLAIQAVISGGTSPAGNLIAQGSCDENDPTNWTALSTEAVADNGSWLFNLENPGYKWARLFWDASGTPGTGTLNARANVKGY